MTTGDASPGYVVGIVDDETPGRSSIAEVLAGYFQRQKKVSIVPFEAFRRSNVQPPQLREPWAYDFDRLYEGLAALKRGESCVCPDGTHIEQSEVLIVEGLHVLYDPRVRALCDARVFVDIDNDMRLSSFIQDACKHGRDIQAALLEYHSYIKPVYDGTFRAQRGYADTVLVGGLDNMKAVRLLVDRIAQVLMLSLSRSSSPRSEEADGGGSE